MQPTTNDVGHPGSLAATGSSVFVVGTATGSGSDYSWSNHSTDDGATWLQGPAGQNFECVVNAFPLVVASTRTAATTA